tara:strand:- start:120 stop:299 length:180 start_codon:yes stop_codon:yes gene_type:complete
VVIQVWFKLAIQAWSIEDTLECKEEAINHHKVDMANLKVVTELVDINQTKLAEEEAGEI